MWIFRWVLILLIMVVFLGFALQNQQQTVSVNVLNLATPNWPLYIFLYVAFVVGLIAGATVTLISGIKFNTEIRKLRKENKRIRLELDRQRNVSIDEDDKTEVLNEPEQAPEPNKQLND